MKLDTLRHRATPEGVELALRPAGPHPRLLAWLVDGAIQFALVSLLGLAILPFGEAGTGVYLLALFTITWFYPVAFEVWGGGATPGKRVLALRVVHDDGTPVAAPASLLRNLVRFADFLPAAYGFGLASCLLTRDFRRLGDIAAGTLVVHRESGVTGEAVPALTPLPPPLALELPEQRALVGFAERAGTWAPERSAELAEVLEPITGLRGRAAVERLLGVANWLVGRR